MWTRKEAMMNGAFQPKGKTMTRILEICVMINDFVPVREGKQDETSGGERRKRLTWEH